MNKEVGGFTLAEVVIVIVILGILAAFAFPRFASMDVESRKTAVNALRSSIRDTAARARSQALARGSPGTITMQGQTITVVNGYPAEASIDDALPDFTGFQFINAAVAKFHMQDAPSPGACKVSYADALGGAPPVITVVTTGC